MEVLFLCGINKYLKDNVFTPLIQLFINFHIKQFLYKCHGVAKKKRIVFSKEKKEKDGHELSQLWGRNQVIV
jgi:hypothetical protein